MKFVGIRREMFYIENLRWEIGDKFIFLLTKEKEARNFYIHIHKP